MITGIPEERTIHVWAVRLHAPDTVTARFAELLSPDEIERAGRFRFDRLKQAFTLARGALRILLGRAADLPPTALRFIYGEKGKPGLHDAGRLRFNLSHSGELALIAITLDCEIGADIEHIRPMPDLRGIAQRFFSSEEQADLLSLPEDQQGPAFFRCWTRKEAYIKATGDGLSTPLDRFAVSLLPDAPARMIQLGGDTMAAAEWTLHDLPVESGYTAAVAYRDRPRDLRCARPLDPGELL